MTNSVVTADWFNDIVARTNGALGTSIANTTAGSAIKSSLFTNLINTASAAALTQNYFLAWPSLQQVAVGQPIHLLSFPTPQPDPETTISWGVNGNQSTAPGTYTWVVPASCTSLMVNWCVGAGGGGGAGTESGNGGGGGGGGSGGFKQYTQITCKQGDKITIVIGAGGAGSPGQNTPLPGYNGGLTSVAINGAIQVTCSGGTGGISVTDFGHDYHLQAGGNGGYPSGLTGQTGPSGVNDYSSSYGGGGAPGPIQGCLGGAGGKMANVSDVGKAGVGPGSGGGGGGSWDRSNGIQPGGGAGQAGYVEICYPSSTASGGTLAQVNTGYAVNAIVNQYSGIIGGGFTGGTGYGGSNASGLF
jgi:hypothetical protein